MFHCHIGKLLMSMVRLDADFSACLQLLWCNWISVTGDLLGEAHHPIREFH